MRRATIKTSVELSQSELEWVRTALRLRAESAEEQADFDKKDRDAAKLAKRWRALLAKFGEVES